jgi:hypothetical protein
MVVNNTHQFTDLKGVPNVFLHILPEIVADTFVVLHVTFSKFLVLVGFILTQWVVVMDYAETWEEWEWFVLPSADVI